MAIHVNINTFGSSGLNSVKPYAPGEQDNISWLCYRLFLYGYDPERIHFESEKALTTLIKCARSEKIKQDVYKLLRSRIFNRIDVNSIIISEIIGIVSLIYTSIKKIYKYTKLSVLMRKNNG